MTAEQQDPPPTFTLNLDVDGKVSGPVSPAPVTPVPRTLFEVVDDLPATPLGLLKIADLFQRQQYPRLARYLRACADVMTVAQREDGIALGPANVTNAWDSGVQVSDYLRRHAPGVAVDLLVPAAHVDDFPTGARFALLRLPDA